ncbi:diels-alderase [Fusarium flagelliforme]|uniref:Diels-alderase n=1 Tax=Fusarium flagelliforme TaxID=2675880 RepID=A0A395MLS8_9HYPO|nr:diels-alderase [Fusarium flagelliforme]
MSNATVSAFTVDKSISEEPVLPSPFIPGSGNVFPKFISVIPKTAWELWYFDGISKNDKSSIVIGVTRNAECLKHGGFKVQVFVVWADERTWHRDLFFPESVVSSDESGVTDGVWKDAISNSSISFSCAGDLSKASLVFDVPGVVQGDMHLEALPGDTGLDTDARLDPSIYYVRPIGRASVKAQLSPCSSDATAAEQFVLGSSANGGMDRVWSPLSWPQVMTESYYLRAQVGPYAMQIMRIFPPGGSEDQPSTMARLYRDGQLICAPQHIVNRDDALITHDSLILSKQSHYDSEDAITGGYRDKNTGYTVEFIGKGNERQRWKFQVRHERIIWNTPISRPGPDGTGNTGFVERLYGGTIGESYEGIGTGGQCELS